MLTPYMFEKLNHATHTCDNEWHNERDHTPADQCVTILFALGDAVRSLRTLEDDVRQRLLELADDGNTIDTAHGTVEVLRKTKRTQWRMDELLADVVTRLADDRTILFDDDGERRPWTASAHLLVDRLRGVVSMPSGKVTGMRAIGLQPDEYCQETPDGWAVRLPPKP